MGFFVGLSVASALTKAIMWCQYSYVVKCKDGFPLSHNFGYVLSYVYRQGRNVNFSLVCLCVFVAVSSWFENIALCACSLVSCFDVNLYFLY